MLLAAFGEGGAAQEQSLSQAEKLDGAGRCVEAEALYREVLERFPASAAALNNFGNHYLICGEPEKARAVFERLLKTIPSHANGRLQLAKLELGHKRCARAIELLEPRYASDAEAAITRSEALAQCGRPGEAQALLTRVDRSSDDPRVQFAVGMAWAHMGLFERAEKAFGSALEKYPDDFDLLYNAGLAAAKAKHFEAAERELDAAAKLKGGDADALYELGRVETALGHGARAVFVLSQARKSAPERAAILLALARAAQFAGYYGDALQSYRDYLGLQPDDEIVRRDWALLRGFAKGGLDEGISALEGYTKKHPRDAVGWYDLAKLMDRKDRDRALSLASAAVKADPDFEPALYFRAWLLNQTGRYEESLAAAKDAVKRKPEDAMALDLEALNLIDLEKPGEAEPLLRAAVGFAPDAPEPLFHLARALNEMGRAEEARVYAARFEKAKGNASEKVLESAGIVESAGLPAAERSERVITELEELAGAKPNDLTLQEHLGTALLQAGRAEEAEAVFERLPAANPDRALMLNCGLVLLRFGRYAAARRFLERAGGSDPEVAVDLAIAVFHTSGAADALEVLDRANGAVEEGDRPALEAQLYDACAQTEKAEQALDSIGRSRITRPELASDAVTRLVAHGRYETALALAGEMAKQAPGDADALLTHAVVLAAGGRGEIALEEIRGIERRYPEFSRAYAAEALVLKRRSQPEEALGKMRTALALGAGDDAVRCVELTMREGKANADCVREAGVLGALFSGSGR